VAIISGAEASPRPGGRASGFAQELQAMTLISRNALPKSAHHELVAVLGRVALVFAFAAIVAVAARFAMGPPLF
jgi:hypothetical protein